ncbi:MAG: hypothetical protein GY806_02745 [Gammaproteobacteria bacterium]|nr:hypothetical protein [Gammaproteobacteria bacterium]
MKIIKLSEIIFVLLALSSITQLASADDHWSDDWEITVDGKSESRGAINFVISFKPDDDAPVREAVTIDVLVAYDTDENDIALFISNTFRAVLGDQDFDIEVDSGEKVEIEAKGDTPDFALAVTASEVRGIRVELDN